MYRKARFWFVWLFSHLLYQNSSFFSVSLVCLFSYIESTLTDEIDTSLLFHLEKYNVILFFCLHSYIWTLTNTSISSVRSCWWFLFVIFERENYVLLDDLLMMKQSFRVSTNDKMKISFTINSNGFIFLSPLLTFYFSSYLLLFFFCSFSRVYKIFVSIEALQIDILSFINRNL